ncbi:MAG: hypothetical protein NVS4B8_00610 [Herpetosiphon sp.]
MFSRRDSSKTDAPTPEVAEPRQPTPISNQAAPAAPAAVLTPAPAPAVRTPVQATAQVSTGGDSSEVSVIARGDTFEGTLRTSRGVRIMGTVRGTIESEQYVRIEENAHVESDVTAAEVVIGGVYAGNLVGRERVEIASTGQVSGRLETAKLMLHEGGYFDGELHMSKPAPGASTVSTPSTASTASAAKPSEQVEGLGRRPRHVDLPSESPILREKSEGDNKSA